MRGKLPPLAFMIATCLTLPLVAAPALRYQTDVRGGFILVGNSLGWDCSNTANPNIPPPIVGAVGACNSNITDTGIDVLWRSDSPANGNAQASSSISATTSRSSANLALPNNSNIVYARLYWSAENTTAAVGNTIVFEKPSVSWTQTLTADANQTLTFVNNGNYYMYQSTVDVTQYVQKYGPGVYRAGNIAVKDPTNQVDEVSYAAWSMVVVYQDAAEVLRNVTLFDGLDVVSANANNFTTAITGFYVPQQAGYDGKFGLVAYEGDATIPGDQFYFNSQLQSNAVNPNNNFFNATHSYFGALTSDPNDLPQLSGDVGSMTGVDFDIVDVTSLIHPGDTNATLRGTSTQDAYFLGVMSVAISTFKPDFTNTTKTYTNMSESNGTRPGDVLEYTISFSNTGTDTATNVVVTDALPSSVAYVPGSIRITSGYNSGAKTDAAGDDQAEYATNPNRLTIRVGSGASATSGGNITTSDAATVIKFQVTVNAGTSGTISNQAMISSKGQKAAMQGIGAVSYNSGNGAAPNAATTAPVDACAINSDCSTAAAPHCNTSASPHTCGGCVASSECTNYTATPVCKTSSNTCVACLTNADCVGNANCTSNACVISGSVAITSPANNASASSTPKIVGTAPANSTVEVTLNGNVVGTTPANGSGAWTYQSSLLATGNYTVTARAISANGATPVSNRVAFTVGNCGALVACTAPDTCTAVGIGSGTCVECTAATSCAQNANCSGGVCTFAAPTVTSPANNSATHAQKPAMGGTAPGNSTVTVVVDGNNIGTTVASSSGAWSLTPALNLPFGAHSVKVMATAGNANTYATSPYSNTNSFSITSGCINDGECTSTAPACRASDHTCVRCTSTANCPSGATCAADNTCFVAAPTVSSPSNSSIVYSSTPQLTGTGPNNATIVVYEDGALVGTTTASSAGAWSLASVSLANGFHTVYAVASFGTGAATSSSNASSTNSFRVINGGCTSSANCSGSTPQCNTVSNTCVACLNTSDCTAPSVCNPNSNACVRCNSDTDCPTGASCSSNACVVTAPVVSAPANNLVTNVSPSTVTGSATAGTSVVVTLDGTAGTPVTADANGKWTYPVSVSLNYGSHSVSAKATLGSGSAVVTSGISNVNTFKVGCLSNTDCSSPSVCNTSTAVCVRCNASSDCPAGATCSANSCGLAAPVVSTPANGAVTNRTTPTITGTSVANANIVVTIDSSTGTAKADGSGSWSYTPSASLSLGSHSVSAVASVGSGAAQVTSGTSNNNSFSIISGCISSSDCSGATPVCRTSDHVCVGCMLNNDCASTPATPVCDPANYVCEGCATSADCSGSTPVCNTAVHTCAACVATTDCPSGATCSSNACVLSPPVISAPSNNQVINNRRPAIAGTSKPNAQVALSIDGTAFNVTADANGNWTYTPASNLTYATHSLSATATVGSGATAVTSAAATSSFQVISGCLADSDCTGAGQPRCNVSSHACVACLGNSDCASTPSTPTCDTTGTNTCVGCVSTANCASGATCSSNVCTLAPPNILAPANNAVTNSTSPAINGNVVAAAAGAKVTVTLDGSAGTAVTADSSGNWTYSPATTLAYGTHTVTAVAAVTSGGTPATSAVSATTTFTVGCLSNTDCSTTASAPNCNTSAHTCARCVVNSDCPGAATCSSGSCVLAKPVITTPAQGSQTPNTTPPISGTSVANANMLVSLDSGAGSSIKADGSGSWTFTPATALSLGDHNVVVTASLGQGALAVSSTSDTTTFRVTVACTSDANCTSPALPVCDTTAFKCVQCTNSTACASNPNAKVCNTSTKSCVQCAVNSDCTSPASCSSSACALAAPSVTQPGDGSTINTPAPTFVGTGVAGATIRVAIDGSAQGASATVDPNGTWSLAASSSLGAGSHTVTATASAGSTTSAPSGTVTFNLIVGCLANSDCSGATPVCNTSSHACVGCTAAGQCGGRQCDTTQQKCVDCLSDSDCGAGAPACSSNTCVRCTSSSYCPAPATCNAPSCVLTTPQVTSPANNGQINNPNFPIAGAADDNVTVLVTLDGNAAVSITADANGNWTFTPPTPLAAGTHTVSAVATAGSGQAQVTSGGSGTTTFQLVVGCLSNADCTAPAAPLCDNANHVCVGCRSSSDCAAPTGKCDTGNTRSCVNCVATSDCAAGAVCTSSACVLAAPTLAAPVNGSTLNTHAPGLNGTAVAGSDVWVYVDSALIGHASADSNGNWSFVMTTTLSDGSHSAYAMATVGSGSSTVSSAASGTNSFTIVSGCVSDADCSGGQPRCKTSSHACVACLGSSDCSAPTPTCDTSQSACVGCLASSDCPSKTPNCDTTAQQCVRCLANSDCPGVATCSVGSCSFAAPAITQPVDGSTLNNPLPTISGTSAANANIVLTLDGNALPAFASGTGSWSTTLTTALNPGSHTLTAVAILGSGDSAVTSQVSSTVGFTLVMGCLADGDCPSAAPHCLSPNHICVACLNSSQCTSGHATVCNPNNSCVECQQNSDCGFDPNKTQCDPASQTCAQCLSDATCPASMPRCDTHGTWACVRCFSDSDCPSGASCKSLQCLVPTPRITAPTAGAFVSTAVKFSGTSVTPGGSIIVLVDCSPLPSVTADANGKWTVTPATAPSSGAHTLAAYAALGTAPNTAQSAPTANQNFTVTGACASDTDCGGSTPYCRTSDGTCVGCLNSTVCAPGVCDPSTDQCVGCVTSSDCAAPGPTTCDTSKNQCVGCLDASQCTDPNAAACDTVAQSCVQCVRDSDCKGATPACDEPTNTCVGCTTSADCSAPKAVCNSGTDQCVGCLSNLDCGGSTPVCELLISQCVGCQSDTDCGGAKPKCDTSKPACARCLSDGDCPTGATCASDSNCFLAAPAIAYPADGNRINDASPNFAGTSAAGAMITVALDDVVLGTVIADSNGTWSFQTPQSLGTGQHDVEVFASVGSGALAITSDTSINVFIVATNCMTAADCGGVTPFCDMDSGMCVECNGNGDCPASAPVCNTATHGCQLCNDAHGGSASAACPNAAQPVCANNGACLACSSDADCAGSADGTVCNTVTGACGMGCSSDADCGATGYCQGSACTPKLANGSPLPSVAATCSAAAAQRVCSSGVCDTGLNTCGHVNGQACASADQCGSGLCDTDGRCGLSNGAACVTAGACRSGTCAGDGLCGLPDNALCRSTPECRGVCFPDGRCGLGAAVACTDAADCRSGVCGDDGYCGANNGAACDDGVECRSSACHAGVCVAACAADADCNSASHCAAGACVANAEPTTCAASADCWPGKGCSSQQCVALSAAGAPCAQATDCASGVCAADGACGLPDAFPCVDPVSCRDGVCSAAGVCGSACGRDADCQNTQFCDLASQACKPLEVNGVACVRDAQCTVYICSALGVCGQVNSAACGTDSACQSNVCAADTNCGKPTSEPCADSTECRSNNCAVGTCTACASDTDCIYGKCDVGTGTCSTHIDTTKYRFAGTGWGCSAAQPAYAAVLTLLWWMRRRRRARGVAALLLALLCVSAPAQAANHRFTLERYNPSAIGETSLWVDRPWYTPSVDVLTVGLTFDYAHDPLRVDYVDGTKTVKSFGLIQHDLIGRLEVAVGFLDRVNVSISLPMVLVERGVTLMGIAPLQKPAFSDPSVAAIGRILGDRTHDAFSLHVGVEVWVPLANTMTASDNGVRVLPKLIGGGMLSDDWDWAATVAFLVRQQASIGWLAAGPGNSVGNEIQVGLASSWYTPDRTFSVGPEVVYANDVASRASGNGFYNSLEVLAGAHWLAVDALRISAGVGTGFFGMPGTPRLRGFLRVAYTPPLESSHSPADHDHDGVPDATDACPTVAGSVWSSNPNDAGCVADHDHDGVPDEQDLCPQEAPGARQDPNRLGCPILDSDKDGVFDPEDLCPQEPQGPHPHPQKRGCPDPDTDNDGVYDSADQCKDEAAGPFPDPKLPGCPLRDRDGDTVPDNVDACPDKRGAPSPKPKENGCPGLVEVKGNQIVILEQVNFVSGKDIIVAKSNNVLEAVKNVLVVRPDVQRISIEGHTDNVGKPQANLVLSAKRAAAVRKWLMQHGIEGVRLESHGFGDTKPLVPNTKPAARAQNRRVEFRIVPAAAP